MLTWNMLSTNSLLYSPPVSLAHRISGQKKKERRRRNLHSIFLAPHVCWYWANGYREDCTCVHGLYGCEASQKYTSMSKDTLTVSILDADDDTTQRLQLVDFVTNAKTIVMKELYVQWI